MRMRPVAVFASLLAILLVAALAPGAFAASAKKRPPAISDLKITPKKPTSADTIDVSFKAGRLRSDERYLVGVDLLAGNDCTAGYQLVVRGRKRLREEVQVRLYPSVGLQRGEGRLLSQTLPEVSFNRFCAGLARVTIGRVDPDGNLKLLASRRVRIAKDAAYPEPLGTPARIEVLAGSSLLVQAPGRPDRTLAVGGLLRGYIPGMFKPNTDVSIKLETGSLTLDTISPDPLCSGGSYKLNFGIEASGPSNLVLQASGSGVLTLELLADPLSLAGCTAPATPGKTTVTVSGKVGPKGLVEFPISGTVAGVPIAPDVVGTVTMNLVVKIDLSGKA